MNFKSSLDELLALYVITDLDALKGQSHVTVSQKAIAGGATALQLRAKLTTTREMLKLGQDLRRLAAQANLPFIVNDRVDVALALNADGVHLGQDDMPVKIARKLMGPDKIIGASVETLEEALTAQEEGADYLGVGSIYSTTTKPDAGTPVGPSRITEICNAVQIPIVGIGGINHSNAAEVLEAGAAGIAVISAVINAPDPEQAARTLIEIIKKTKEGLRHSSPRQ